MKSNISYVQEPALGQVAYARPPAKLNLFLELLSRRDDGYHEIETVMVPIDWRDELVIRRRTKSGITMQVDWAPSIRVLAERLGIADAPDTIDSILGIPPAHANLVYKAIDRFQRRFKIPGGFDCQLRKLIPAGAGLGGASSDAASALRCAASLCGISSSSEEMFEIASSIGSDVPFFLGVGGKSQAFENREAGRNYAVRATGRGERLEGVEMATCLHFVVVYPCRSLSTASVYARCEVPQSPLSSRALLSALRIGEQRRISECMCNRLSESAKKIAPLIDEILESMWQSGLHACQLTGSGSACFAIAESASRARRCAARLQSRLQPGALIKVARSTSVPTIVFIQ